MQKLKLFIAAFLIVTSLNAQVTTLGNNSLPIPQMVGYNGTGFPPKPLQIRNDFNQPINLFTNNIWRASVTTNNGLTNTNLANYNFNVVPQTGDGIQIRAGVGSNPNASIDIFTSLQNQTFIRMDGTTLQQTTNNRFETISNLNGFWYNATGNGANGATGPFIPQFIWNILQQETGRLGSNTKWRFGLNPTNLNANNRVEISASATDPYFATNNSSGLRFTNLTSAKNTVPNGTNGVNNQKLLTVDQNGDVVLTDAPTTPAQTSNNGVFNNAGVFQLGVPCSSPIGVKVANGLTTNRMIHLLGNNFVFADGGRVGFGLAPIAACAVGNKVEIRATNLDPYASNVSGWGASGLRLGTLTSLNAVTPNGINGINTTKVLSVDQNGDVVLINPSGTNLGNLCTAPQNLLTGNYEIPLNQNNFYFSGQQTTGDRVAVGINCGTGLVAKFNVLLNQTYNTSFTTGNSAGLFRNTNTGVAHNVGVKGEVLNGPGDNSGGYFVASSSNINANNNGVTAEAANSPGTNRGGYFSGIGGTDAIGITARAAFGSLTNYAGYFQGDVYINGPSQVAGLALTASDQTFKTNIDTISNVKSLISQLKPRTFYYDTLNSAGINFTSKKQYGLIAQDVELLLPELVGSTTKPAERDSLGNITIPATTYKNLNYNAFIAILIKGMQEQQKTIDSLKVKTSKQDSINNAVQAQIAALTSSVSSCCSNSSVRTTKPEDINQLNIDLSDKDIIVLNQNVPNPFAEQTTITYNVPEKYGYAQIIFSTIEGKIIKAVDITKKGRGQLNVFASDLSSGMYTYSLVVDGNIIDTKKMVKSE